MIRSGVTHCVLTTLFLLTSHAAASGTLHERLCQHRRLRSMGLGNLAI